MELLTQSEFARYYQEQTGKRISRQAISLSIIDGRLPFIQDGKKKKINPKDKLVQLYMGFDKPQKKQIKKKVKSKKLSSEKQTKKQSKLITKSKKQPEKQSKNMNTSKFEDLDPFEMRRRSQFADMRKRELQVLILEKKYLPIEFIDGVYIRYMENFNNTIERLSSTYINDVGKKILEEGEVLPEHIEKFNSLILETMHNNKKTIKRFLKNYEPEIKR